MEERNYKLYMHISPSDKKYIGITKQEPKVRWGYGCKYKENQHFYRAIQKYGWNNFKHIIIRDNLTEYEAKKLEIYLIALFDTTDFNKGYNITKGGEGGNGYVPSEEVRRKQSEIHSGENNAMYGRAWYDENTPQEKIDTWKENISKATSGENNPMYGRIGKKSPVAKSVICLTTKRLFWSATEGANYYGIKGSSGISNCCKVFITRHGKKIKIKSYGKLSDGTKLVWRYLIVNHNKILRGKDISKLHTKSINKIA